MNNIISIEIFAIIVTAVFAFFISRSQYAPSTPKLAVFSLLVSISLFLCDRVLWANTNKGIFDHGTCLAAPTAAACNDSTERLLSKLDINSKFTSPSATKSVEVLTNEQPQVNHIGGGSTLSNRNLIESISNAPNLKTFNATLKAADLIETLSGPGPFTVFVPEDAAFAKLPAGTIDTLLKPQSKETLLKILAYHIVAGKLDLAALSFAVEVGRGKAELYSISVGRLTATKEGDAIVLTDDNGGKSKITQADIIQSNGVLHTINTVMLPKAVFP